MYMFPLVTRISQGEGIFEKINVFYNVQRKMSVFEKKKTFIIFLMRKYEQKIILDP